MKCKKCSKAAAPRQVYCSRECAPYGYYGIEYEHRVKLEKKSIYTQTSLDSAEERSAVDQALFEIREKKKAATAARKKKEIAHQKE